MKIFRELPKNLKLEDNDLFPNSIKVSIIDNPVLKDYKKIILSEFNLFSIKSFKFINYLSMMQVSKFTTLDFIKQLMGSLKRNIKTHIKKQKLWIINDHCFNYFHWVTEALPRLLLIKENKIKGTVLLPSTWSSNTFITSSLDIVGYEYEYYDLNSTYYLPEIISPNHLAGAGNYNPKYIKLVKNSLKKDYSENLRLWVLRDENQPRHIKNRNELCILLEKFKIQIIRPEELSFQQQVSFFSKASFVGGIHGAGLTNMIFMDEESNVLEIKTKSTEKNNAFFTLSSALNHNYYYLRSKDEDTASGIILDLNELNHQFTALFD